MCFLSIGSLLSFELVHLHAGCTLKSLGVAIASIVAHNTQPIQASGCHASGADFFERFDRLDKAAGEKEEEGEGPTVGADGGAAPREGDRRGDAGASRKPGAGGEEEEEEGGEGEDEEEAGFEDDDDYLQVLPCFRGASYLAWVDESPMKQAGLVAKWPAGQ